MEKIFYSIGKAAAIVKVTTETLRHYDRIGLVRPSITDQWTKYRYYTEQDIIRLNVVVALRNMGISLKNIKAMLDSDDIQQLTEEFDNAIRQTDDKIRELREAKNRIANVKRHYESKRDESRSGIAIKDISPRVILLADRSISPTIEDLHDYHRHFYAQVGESRRSLFLFEDVAGIYEKDGSQKMFTVCTRHDSGKDLFTLPGGKYLCAECSDKTYENVLEKLFDVAKKEYNAKPQYVIRIIKLTGILQWKYEIQIFID